MSKRQIEDRNLSPPSAAAKKMTEHQSTDIISPSEEKMFRYKQSPINVASWYLATKLADVYFVFDSDDGTVIRVPAHKNLLATASDVFERMFCGELKENGDIKIVDSSAAAFKEFLQFFYLKDVKLSAKYAAAVLDLGNKYNVENCVDACVQILSKELSIENVCMVLSLGILYDQNKLKKSCEKQITLNTTEVFKSAGFLDCTKGVLAHILKMNKLALSCSEVAVFEACMDWVRCKSKRQVLSKALVKKHLGDLYYQIRFASMTSKEFCALEAKYSAVLSSDFKAIIRLIEREDGHSEHFNTSPRQVESNDTPDAYNLFCILDKDPKNTVRQALDSEGEIVFSTSEPLLLGGFQCNSIRLGHEFVFLESDLSIKVEITEAPALDGANVKVLSNMIANVGSDLSALIALPHPILIRPGYFYTIRTNGFPNGHYFGLCEQKSSITLGSGIKIELHNDKVAEEKTVGLIWMLAFNEI